jgi:hypothetical protein
VCTAEATAKLLEEQIDKNQQVYYFDEDSGMQAMPAMREGLIAPSGNITLFDEICYLLAFLLRLVSISKLALVNEAFCISSMCVCVDLFYFFV